MDQRLTIKKHGSGMMILVIVFIVLVPPFCWGSLSVARVEKGD